MNPKLTNICTIIKRNKEIENVVYDNYLGFKVNADKKFLEGQIISWSNFDVSNEDEEIFFKVYVQRYLSHSENLEKMKEFKGADVSALLIIDINNRGENDIKNTVGLSFHGSYDAMNIELLNILDAHVS